MSVEQDVPLLVDLRGAALLLGLSRNTLRRMIARGEITVVRLGAKIWIERCEIDALVARHRVPAGAT